MKKIENIDKLLTSSDKNKSIIELDDFVCELCNWGEELDKLTDPQKNFYFNQNLEREINNGGFNQYFINFSGDFAHETIVSLKMIGANKTADLLQSAIDQFPEKKAPKERKLRQEIISQIDDLANEMWNNLDQQFFKYEEDLNSLNLEFVRQNKDSF